MKRSFIILLCIITPLMGYQISWPQSVKETDELFKKAEKYFFQKKFEMAEAMLQRVITLNPEHGRAYSYLGDIFLKKRRYDGALNCYRKSIDLNTDVGENYFRIGQVYYYKKIGNVAIEYFKKAIAIDKKLKFAYYHIGLSFLMLMRDKKNTIVNWEKYLSIAPDDPQYEKIRRAIELLRDPNFKIPPEGSDVSIEEALLLGGLSIDKVEHDTSDKQAGQEDKKSKRVLEDIYLDDDL